MLWPAIFLHIALVIKPTPLPIGGLFISPSCGGSVASAKAPSVSMIRLTHSNWTAVRGADPDFKVKDHYNFVILAKKSDSKKHLTVNTPEMHAETKLIIRATILTVSWNWTNFWMFMYTARPHFATFTIVEKLSSNMMTSAVSFATCGNNYEKMEHSKQLFRRQI